jgi:GNAT superfamily N-acetyltransferase
MVIRPATSCDRPKLLEMAGHFLAASAYGKLLPGSNPEGLGRLVDSIIAPREDMLAIVAADEAGVFGMLGLMAAPHLVNGAPYGDELIWWVEPDHRGASFAGPKLLEHAENWARQRGLNMIKMVAPADNPAVARFYGKRGYVPIETHFVKGLL